jgi:hypothetical protein
MQEKDRAKSEEKAEADLKVRLDTIKAVNKHAGISNLEACAEANAAVALNVLKETLGDYGPYEGRHYSLSDKTRDILIAHARQDAAHALANTVDIMRVMDRVERGLRRALWLVSVLTVVSLTLVFVWFAV